ncbi:MAG: transcriptional regulator, partial [Clostridia bacterium]|nr:transcriptional regulator [Clostridia bacterium]
LFGVGSGGSAYWGEPTTFLGWYADEEMISREINEIHRAISQGIPMYTLQYSAKTERRFASVKIIEE